MDIYEDVRRVFSFSHLQQIMVDDPYSVQYSRYTSYGFSTYLVYKSAYYKQKYRNVEIFDNENGENKNLFF